MIANELQSQLIATHAEQSVADIRVGARYTAAMLADGNVGVAYTFRERAAGDPPLSTGRQFPVGGSTTEMLAYLGSDDRMERGVGLAVANAIANESWTGEYEGDVLHVLSIGFQDRVGMVGYCGPLVAPLQKRVRELVVFDRDATRAEGVLPAEQALVQLPRCSVVIIAATALVLGDLDPLLAAATGCREIAVVGASTPMVPGVFKPAGVTLLAGIRVTDGPGVLRVVSEGGGMQAFGQRMRKVHVRP